MGGGEGGEVGRSPLFPARDLAGHPLSHGAVPSPLFQGRSGPGGRPGRVCSGELRRKVSPWFPPVFRGFNTKEASGIRQEPSDGAGGTQRPQGLTKKGLILGPLRRLLISDHCIMKTLNDMINVRTRLFAGSESALLQVAPFLQAPCEWRPLELSGALIVMNLA